MGPKTSEVAVSREIDSFLFLEPSSVSVLAKFGNASSVTCSATVVTKRAEGLLSSSAWVLQPQQDDPGFISYISPSSV